MDQHDSGGRTMVSVRLTRAEQDGIRAAADRRGESLSSFVRRASLGEAGIGRRAAASGATQTATIGAALVLTDSGRLVASPLTAPAVSAQFDARLSAGDPSGDVSQRALHGVRSFTDQYED